MANRIKLVNSYYTMITLMHCSAEERQSDPDDDDEDDCGDDGDECDEGRICVLEGIVNRCIQSKVQYNTKLKG